MEHNTTRLSIPPFNITTDPNGTIYAGSYNQSTQVLLFAAQGSQINVTGEFPTQNFTVTVNGTGVEYSYNNATITLYNITWRSDIAVSFFPDTPSTYVVEFPPFILESTTPFVTERYQPDGVTYSPYTNDLYFEVVGGGNVTVWAPDGFPGRIKNIDGWGTFPFSWVMYIIKNTPIWDFANNTVTFCNLPTDENMSGSVIVMISFYNQSNIDDPDEHNTNTDTDDKDEGNNAGLPDLGSVVNSALGALPEPLRAPVAFTLVGLPIILILLILTGGGATVKGMRGGRSGRR